MELRECKASLEAMLFAYGEPLSAARMAQALESDEETITRVLRDMARDYEEKGRGLCLFQLEGEWQLATKSQYRQPVQKVLDTRRAAPLSAAAMETLAIIAYNQPVSRSFIEQVRGVDSSSSVSNLLEKGLIEEAGRLDLPGRPVSFRTTDVFLRCFGLSGLADLPDPHGGVSGLPLEQLAATGSLPADTQPLEEV